ncbi:MAG: cell surface protein [Myxococcota bacterium]
MRLSRSVVIHTISESRSLVWPLLLTACSGLDEELTPSPTPTPSPYVQAVDSFEPGEAAGFGQDLFPTIVYGPPVGGGVSQGSVDVLSLGLGGEIVLSFGILRVVDGDGPDFVVFENPFYITEGVSYAEPAQVSVSLDGERWTSFPCALSAYPYEGCAGVTPVTANLELGISPLDPAQAGGDLFDLASIGVAEARYVRITDGGVVGVSSTAPAAGFDLDAVALLHHRIAAAE